MDSFVISASESFSASALRVLADEIEVQGVTDTKYKPANIGLVQDENGWTALATMVAVDA